MRDLTQKQNSDTVNIVEMKVRVTWPIGFGFFL